MFFRSFEDKCVIHSPKDGRTIASITNIPGAGHMVSSPQTTFLHDSHRTSQIPAEQPKRLAKAIGQCLIHTFGNVKQAHARL
jgi:D-alanine-D-alanine ligase-like ATP-grasp enzyme